MNELKSLEAEALNLVRLAKKAGADACDVVVASGNSLSIAVRDGVVENNNRSEGDSFSLRAFCGKKMASVNSNTKSDPQKLAERVVAMAKVSPEDPFQGLADQNDLCTDPNLHEKIEALELFDDFVPDVGMLEKLATNCEKSGLAVNGVTKSMGAGAGWSTSGFVLATSDGFTGSYQRSGFYASASLVAGEGGSMERDYDYDSKIHFSDLRDAEDIGKLAGERTVKRLNPKQVKSGSFPIVVDPRISPGILQNLVSAINGAAITRKTSFLRDKMGEAVANSAINIVDDPHMLRQPGSKLFDGEGVRSEKFELVANGILQTWILDSAAARELELQTNGRASRSGSGTNPATTNCYIKAGHQSPETIISSITEGLFLTETIGHGVNMVTGDFSKGASGFWIKDGEIAFPVAGITIAGNLADMFLNMTPANDLEFKQRTNAPTLLIEGMTVGGT
ncbi:MAG: TldD/PmbA family protein [Pseudomonadota bacterium]